MKLSLLFFGKAEYILKSSYPEEFINEVRRKIPVRNLEKISKTEISLCCFYSDASFIENTAKQMNVEVVSKKYGGLKHTLYKYRKRTGLFIGISIAILMLFVSQLFVLRISVEGNESVPKESIINTLRKIGFYEGRIKKRVDIDSLVNMFLINEKRISWIAVNFDGTVAHVEVKERKTMDKAVKKQNVNLVASHDGLILRVDALAGQTIVEKGDVVTKGKLLVSAFVSGRSGEISLRGAKGFVWANTIRKYQVVMPLKYYEKKYTGKVGKRRTLEFFGVKIVLPKVEGRALELCEKTSACNDVMLFGKLSFPARISTDSYKEYILCEKRRTENEASVLALEKAKEMLFKDSNSCKIADVESTYRIEDGMMIFNCVFECVENIAHELEFDLS